MKKVGILTFHEADNYGASLQAYALLKSLKGKVDAEIINYHCQYILEQIIDVNGLSLPKKIIALAFKKNKHRKFKKFTNDFLKLSNDYTTDNKVDINNIYDMVIVGSDQVWNLECTNSDNTYFLDFINDNTIATTYAASFGSASFPGKDYYVYLKRFHTISLREEKYVDEIRKYNNNVRIDIDPTLLLPRQDWESFILKKRPIKQKYVFVYLVGEQIELIKKANEYALANKCKVITNKNSIDFFLKCSPVDFLNWIYYSDYIFTNSFHGTVFSIVYHKKLVVECNIKGGYNNRASDLLSKTELEILKIENCFVKKSIDWDAVDEKLNLLRVDSNKYIDEMIGF